MPLTSLTMPSATMEDGHKKERKLARHHSNHRHGSNQSREEQPPQPPQPQVNGAVSKLPSHRRPSRDPSRHLPNGVSRSYDGSSKSSNSSKVDYSLYLVADATPRILGDRDIIRVVDSALRGGNAKSIPEMRPCMIGLASDLLLYRSHCCAVSRQVP